MSCGGGGGGGFYVMLLSNASMDRHPENTVASFTNVLKEPVTLDSQYEVALVEIHTTNSVFNVAEGGNEINVRFADPVGLNAGAFDMTVYVPPGLYTTRPQLLDAINFVLKTYKVGKLSIDPMTHLTLFVPEDEGFNPQLEITMSTALCIQLGYEPACIVNRDPIAVRPGDLTYAAPAHLLVYCDIIEEQFVGDVRAPLLRMINSDYLRYDYGASVTKGFMNLMYMPLSRRVFSSVTIDICSPTGQRIAFNNGRSALLLHFRRRAPDT